MITVATVTKPPQVSAQWLIIDTELSLCLERTRIIVSNSPTMLCLWKELPRFLFSRCIPHWETVVGDRWQPAHGWVPRARQLSAQPAWLTKPRPCAKWQSYSRPDTGICCGQLTRLRLTCGALHACPWRQRHKRAGRAARWPAAWSVPLPPRADRIAWWLEPHSLSLTGTSLYRTTSQNRTHYLWLVHGIQGYIGNIHKEMLFTLYSVTMVWLGKVLLVFIQIWFASNKIDDIFKLLIFVCRRRANHNWEKVNLCR